MQGYVETRTLHFTFITAGYMSTLGQQKKSRMFFSVVLEYSYKIKESVPGQNFFTWIFKTDIDYSRKHNQGWQRVEPSL